MCSSDLFGILRPAIPNDSIYEPSNYACICSWAHDRDISLGRYFNHPSDESLSENVNCVRIARTFFEKASEKLERLSTCRHCSK